MKDSTKNTLAIILPLISVIFIFIYLTNKPQEEVGTKESTPSMSIQKTYESAPEMQLEEGKNYKAVIHANFGDINLDLFENESPVTVNNFAFLSKEGFYNETIFHRIIKGFMIQGGDPLGNGTGGPGYSFDDEPITRDYTAGTIAMANSGPNTNGSQFFIMHKDYDLPKNYVVFGRVESDKDLEIVDRIANVPVTQGLSGEPSSPTQEVIINSVDIIAQ